MSFFEKLTNRFDDSEYTATIKSNTKNNPQPQAPRTSTKELLTDEALLQRVATAIQDIIPRRFQDKKKRNANLTIDQFIDEQLSSSGSSLPSFTPALQKSLEREMTEEERPQSRSWLSNRWSRLKRNKNYDLQYFLDSFKEKFHQEDYSITTQTEEEKEEAEVEDLGDETSKEDEFRTVTFTVGKVLKSNIGYEHFINVLKENQQISNNCIFGVQHVLSIITNMILSGELNSVLNDEETTQLLVFLN